jgi:hypothetical protein
MENEEVEPGSNSPALDVETKTELGQTEPEVQQVPEGPDWNKLGPELQAKLDAVSNDLAAYKASVSLGVSDWDHFEVVKWQWEKSDRSQDISTWLGDMISGKVPVPKIIAPFIASPPSGPSPAKVEVPQPKIVAPSTVAGQNISTKISSQVLAEARRKAALGDATELRSLLGRGAKKV